MHHWLDPGTRPGAAMLDSMVNRQAQIVAYADDYVMLILTIVPALFLLMLMRIPGKVVRPAE